MAVCDKACGRCCVNNGMIPPILKMNGCDEGAPDWLVLLVNHLRKHFGDISEQHPCLFLTADMRCSLHDVYKPEVCRDFLCAEQR